MVARKTNTQDTIQSPFGMVMPGRNWTAATAEGYGFGAQGSLNDPEINKIYYSTFYRELDSGHARWWSIDSRKKSSESPYALNRNNPILNSDPLGDCPPGEDCNNNSAIGAKASFGLTLGNTNENISFSLNFTYANQGENLTTEYTLGLSITNFTKVNNIGTVGESVTFMGSALFGTGGNTNLAGSGIVGGTPIYNSDGTNGFNGGGIGFTSINLLDPGISELSNFSMNLLGRFTVSETSFSVNLMEDYPFSDKGSTGSLLLNLTYGLENNQSFSLGFASETFTDKGAGAIPAPYTDPSQNMIQGALYYSTPVTGAPNYGANSFTFGYNSNYLNMSGKAGLFGGKQGAASQNFIHTKVMTLGGGEGSPVFTHDTSYFGKLFGEITLNGAIYNQ